jgi:hypothetical protein
MYASPTPRGPGSVSGARRTSRPGSPTRSPAASSTPATCACTRSPVFREGATWDRLYQTLVDYWPDLLSYETKSSYTFPVVRLDPVASPPAIPEPG